MTSKKRKAGRRDRQGDGAVQVRASRRYLGAVIALGLVAMGIVALYLRTGNRRAGPQATPDVPVASASTGSDAQETSTGNEPSSIAPGANSAPQAATTPRESDRQADTSQDPFGVLQGRWLRPDGNYVMEIKRIDADGTVEATYNNPRPIRVSAAKALKEEGATKLLVELRDVGYPGCVYRLEYDPDNDRLQGTYYQAAMQQQFEVVFVRMK